MADSALRALTCRHGQLGRRAAAVSTEHDAQENPRREQRGRRRNEMDYADERESDLRVMRGSRAMYALIMRTASGRVPTSPFGFYV